MRLNLMKLNLWFGVKMNSLENKTLSELAAFLQDKAADYISAKNWTALVCWYIRINHFSGNAKKAAQWVRANSPIKDIDQICRLMAVGRMIAACSENADVYNFLLNLPTCKNEVLTALDAGKVIQFVTEKGEKTIQNLCRDDLRNLVNTFLGREVRNKPEKLFQPDLLIFAEKAFRAYGDTESKKRIAAQVVRKEFAESMFKSSLAGCSVMSDTCFNLDIDDELMQEWRRKCAEVEELGKQVMEAIRQKKEIARSRDIDGINLPVKQEKQPAPVKENVARSRDIRDIKDYSDEQIKVGDNRLQFCYEVYNLNISGLSINKAIRQVQESGNRFELARTYNRTNAGEELTEQNYYRWIDKLDKDENGVPVWDRLKLAPNVTGRKSSGFKGPEEFKKILLAIYLSRNQFGVQASYDEAVKLFRKNHPELSNVALPDVTHCRYWLKKTPKAVEIMCREGEVAYKNKVERAIYRDWSQVKVNDCWFADNRKFDIMVRKYNKEKNRWEAVRPWVCAFSDSKSWKIVGWSIGTDSIDSRVVINTFARAIHDYGEPASVYFDNGGDFQKRGFSQPVQFDQNGPKFSILEKLGILLHTSNPYNGRAKTIERVFGNFSRHFDKLFPCYLGNNPTARPENAAMYSKGDNVMFLPSLQEFTEEFEKWLAEYHTTQNKGKILNGDKVPANQPGLSPEQAFAQLPRITRPKRSEEEYKRCFLLPLDELRKVMRGGAVVIDKQDYVSDALYEYLDRKVMVQIDLVNRDHVYAFTPEGKYIAECIRPGTVPALVESEEDKKLLADEMQRQRISLKTVKENVSALTGGQLDKFSTQQLNQATPEQFRKLESGSAKVGIAGEYHSVQGDHAAKIYSLPGSKPPESQPPPQPAEEMSEEERKRHKEIFDAMYE